tara:strand:+ start:21334 stop:21495 length:162 start_codon:yes stop_codon:yes gene_type:complete
MPIHNTQDEFSNDHFDKSNGHAVVGEKVIWTDVDDGKEYTMKLDKGVFVPIEI